MFTWNINVHWYNSVTSSDHRVGVMVVASSVSTAGKASFWKTTLGIETIAVKVQTLNNRYLKSYLSAKKTFNLKHTMTTMKDTKISGKF